MSTKGSHQRYEILLMRAVDGVLSEIERGQLDKHLETCDRCAAELQDFSLIKETTDAMTARILRHADIEPPRPRGASRALLTGSLVAMLIGAVVLLAFAGYTLLVDGDVPGVVKLGAGACGAGAVGLLVYVLRIRYRAARRDPYEEIDL